MTSSYHRDMPKDDDMAVNTQFMFTEGHIRLLIWMCEAQALFIEEACDDVLKEGSRPSENLMNCREGVADLKCWALRLLDALEEEDDDEVEMDDDEAEFIESLSEQAKTDVEALRDALQIRWDVHRSAGGQKRRTPLQGLRDWLRSLL